MIFQFFLIFVLIFPRGLLGIIDRYYDHYETLHHNSFKHHIVRRDLYSEHPTQRVLEFDAHGRHFKLVLHKSTSLVAEDFKVTFVNENGTHAMRFDPGIYQGYLEDEPTASSVTAYWDESTTELTATISTVSDVFIIEPSWRFLPASDDYNLISYKASDLRRNKMTEPGTCAAAANNVKKDDAKKSNVKKDDDSRSSRNRRSSESQVYLPQKTCQVRLVADYRFFKGIGKSDRSTTAKYLLGLMGWVDILFRSNRFATCGEGFGFEIKNITVHESPTYGKYVTSQRQGKNLSHYNDDNAKWHLSEDLLEAFTRSEDSMNNSQYCLVHLFTAVGFHSNVFGVAYVGNPHNKTNGICSDFNKNKIGVTNTAWTTFVDRDSKPLPARQAYLVTAHEFGHGWGSHHDPDLCVPRDIDGGKYLMFHSAVNGLQRNNELFSNCSKASICDVLKSRSRECFTSKSMCGNFVRDAGEDCDEGPGGISLSNQPCCENCKFKRGSNCSDWNDKCCLNCHFANSSKVCHEKGDDPCTEETFCSGSSPNCSTPIASEDGSYCLTRSKTGSGAHGNCTNKICVALCEAHNLTSCLCDAVNTSCQVCCRNDTEGGICTEFYKGPIDVPNNTPCPMGVCVNGTCQKVTGVTVVRPWNFINFESAGAFVIFMKNNIVGSVIVISLFLWIPASCGVSYIDRKRARELRDEDAHFDIMSQLIASSVNSLTKIKMTSGTIERKGIYRSREYL